MNIRIEIIYLYVFIIGSCVTSFANLLIYRIPLGINFVKGRSYCPHCGKTLKWYELIPIFSYMFLRGKCKSCKTRITPRELLLELSGGFLAMFCLYRFDVHFDALFAFLFCIIFVVITFIDFDTLTIPNGILIVFMICTMLYSFLHPEVSLLNRMIGFFSVSLPMVGLTLWIKNCFGGGDIKLIAIAGWLLGWQTTILAFFIALLIAGCYASYLLLSKRMQKQDYIAFGPYLCFGIMMAFCYGANMIETYQNYIIFI